MKIKKPNKVEVFVLVLIFIILFLLALPSLMKIPTKHATRAYPPPISALKMIHLATLNFEIREQKAPSRLIDLEGTSVRMFNGKTVSVTLQILEHELGTNLSILKYVPELSSVPRITIGANDIPLAYLEAFDDSNFCNVVFRNGRTDRIVASELQALVNRQRIMLQTTTNSFDATRQP